MIVLLPTPRTLQAKCFVREALILTAKLSNGLAIPFPRLTSGPTGGKEVVAGRIQAAMIHFKRVYEKRRGTMAFPC